MSTYHAAISIPGAGNRLGTLSAVTVPGQSRNVTLDEGKRASRDDTILLPFVGSTQSLEESFQAGRGQPQNFEEGMTSND